VIIASGARRLFVEIEGNPAAQPTLLALHGGPGFAHNYFRPGLTALARCGFAVIYVDLPGGGKSSRHPGAGSDLKPFLADIDAVRRAVRPERLIVLGHAWGAILAAEYALTSPVAGIILVNPLRILRPEGQDAEAQARRVAAVDPSLYDRYRERLQPMIERARAGETELWERVNSDFWWSQMMETQLANPASEDWRQAIASIAWGIEAYFQFKGAAFAKPGHPLSDYDLSEQTRGVRTPALIFASDNDANYVAPARIHAMSIADSMRAPKVVRLDDYGHFPFAEAPGLFAAAAADFLHSLR
jgi:pimeloyl-ACP methyl ester carboxylesterase